jgi:hypothetical protein
MFELEAGGGATAATVEALLREATGGFQFVSLGASLFVVSGTGLV